MKRIFFCLILLVILYIKLITLKTSTILDLHNKIVKNGVSIKTITANVEGYIISTQKPNDLAEMFIQQLNAKKNSGLQSSTIKGKFEEPITKVKVISTSKENVFYVTLMLSQQNNVKNINNIIGKIIQIFEKFKGKPKIYLGFDGIINKKMSIMQMKNKACEILIACGSKNISTIEDGNIISVIGLTPMITDSIYINGVKENLNIALKCINSEGFTKLWAFSPLIQKEY